MRFFLFAHFYAHRIATGLGEKLAECQAELERQRDEASALKALVLLCEEHGGDIDYKAYLSGEISAIKASVAAEVKEVISHGEKLRIQNSELRAKLDKVRLDRQAASMQYGQGRVDSAFDSPR